MNLVEILKSGQKDLLKKSNTFLKEQGYDKILCTSGYIFAEGTLPVMLVAHLDVIHKTQLDKVFYDKKQDVMWSPQGIGGDDRCGVYAIFSIIESGYRPYVLLATDEEIGGVGSSLFAEQYQYNLKEKIKYMIEIDRRGNNQAVFYNCGNKEFEKYILSFGFKKEYGSFTDISVLSPAYDIASVNLSAGYYNEHTLQEYIQTKHLLNTITVVKTMLNDIENSKFYDYQEIKTVYDYTKNGGVTPKTEKIKKEYEDIDDTVYWKMYDDWFTLSDEEWKKKYDFEKPPTAEEVWDW